MKKMMIRNELDFKRTVRVCRSRKGERFDFFTVKSTDT